jgi:hypothetical protein
MKMTWNAKDIVEPARIAITHGTRQVMIMTTLKGNNMDLLQELEHLDDDELMDLQSAITEELSNRGETRFTARFDYWERSAPND